MKQILLVEEDFGDAILAQELLAESSDLARRYIEYILSPKGAFR